jgi:uncharacterized membrane protein
MMSTTRTAYFSAGVLGVLAGMRSMTPPALVSFYLSRNRPSVDSKLIGLLASRRSTIGLALLAAGELSADKFPQTPARTFAPALLGRIGTGALAAAALCAAKGQNRWIGATIGAVATVSATFATYYARLAVNRRLPNVASGLLEDSLLLGAGWWLLRRWQRSAKNAADV